MDIRDNNADEFARKEVSTKLMWPEAFCLVETDVWKGILNEREDKEQRLLETDVFEIIKTLVGREFETCIKLSSNNLKVVSSL